MLPLRCIEDLVAHPIHSRVKWEGVRGSTWLLQDPAAMQGLCQQDHQGQPGNGRRERFQSVIDNSIMLKIYEAQELASWYDFKFPGHYSNIAPRHESGNLATVLWLSWHQ